MLDVREAARQLGVSPSMLYALVARRAITHYRIGSRIAFSEADLTAFLEFRKVRVTAPPRPHSLPALRHVTLPRALPAPIETPGSG